jgi:hypothetical protein
MSDSKLLIEEETEYHQCDICESEIFTSSTTRQASDALVLCLSKQKHTSENVKTTEEYTYDDDRSGSSRKVYITHMELSCNISKLLEKGVEYWLFARCGDLELPNSSIAVNNWCVHLSLCGIESYMEDYDDCDCCDLHNLIPVVNPFVPVARRKGYFFLLNNDILVKILQYSET